MNYQTFEPGPGLASLIKCYWTLESPKEETPEKQTIVPDGCMEMIFHYGDLYRQYKEDGTSIIQPKCFVIGQLTRPLEIEPTGETGIFSVRFHPHGFLPFTTIPIHELENTAVSLTQLFGNNAQEVAQPVLNARTTAERIKQVETFLLRRLTDSKTIDRIVKLTVETIITANGQLSVHELSKHTEISRRQLERKFAAAIGLSPKQLSKTIRLQATLKMLVSKNFTSFTALAHHGEYYDRPTLTRTLRSSQGLPPKSFTETTWK